MKHLIRLNFQSFEYPVEVCGFHCRWGQACGDGEDGKNSVKFKKKKISLISIITSKYPHTSKNKTQ